MNEQNRKNEMPEWLPRATLVVIGTALAAYVGLMILGRLGDLVAWLVTALFLSFALEPLVNRLHKRGWKRGLATGLILVGAVLLFGLFLGAMIPLVIDQVRELVRSAPQWVERITDLMYRWFEVEITTDQLLDQIKQADVSLGTAAGDVAGNIINVSGKILAGIFQLFTILLFTFYFVAEGPAIRRKLMTMMPAHRQKQLLETWEIAMEKTAAYLYSRLILAGISAVITLIVLLILGVPFALPLALFMGLVSQFVPVVGTYIAAAVPLLVILLSNPVGALIFLIYIVLYQQIENYLLSPRLTKHTMQLHPAIAIGAALAGGILYGAVGAFLALPMAAILQATLGALFTRHDVISDSEASELLGYDKKDIKSVKHKKIKR